MIEKLITEISLDLYGETKHYQVSAKQNDKNSRSIMITLLDNGAIFQLPLDVIALVNVKKPDGKFVYNQCRIVDDKVIVDMTNQMLAAAGTAYADINIKNSEGSQLLSSASFAIEIEPSMRNEKAILSSNEMTLIDEQIKKIEDEELIRIKSEKERIVTEKERNEFEQSRLTAESERIKAENKRKSDTSATISKSEEVTKESQSATRNAKDVTIRAEAALYNQANLEATLNQVIAIKSEVGKDKTTVSIAKDDVINESIKIKETIKNASVSAAKEVLESINKVAEEIKNQYGTLFICADGGSASSIDYLTINGGSPTSVDSIKLDAGNPFSI